MRAVFLLVLTSGCAVDLIDTYEWSNGSGDGPGGDGPRVVTVDDGPFYETVVDATSVTEWVGMDLDAGGDEDVGIDNDVWDLRFQRFHISVNGGISGDMGGEAVFVPDLALADATEAPADGWVTDEADSDDENTDPDYALHTWYLYDEETHVLTPDPGVWFVRTTDGQVFPLEVRWYYDEAGSSGVVTFGWADAVPEAR